AREDITCSAADARALVKHELPPPAVALPDGAADRRVAAALRRGVRDQRHAVGERARLEVRDGPRGRVLEEHPRDDGFPVVSEARAAELHEIVGQQVLEIAARASRARPHQLLLEAVELPPELRLVDHGPFTLRMPWTLR